MILKDEINRYGFPNIFGFAVSFAGKLLTGIDPTDLNPVYALNNYQNYYFISLQFFSGPDYKTTN